MSNNNEQNDRQSPLSQPTVPSTSAPTDPRIKNANVTPTDPRIKNAIVTPTDLPIKKCRDFVWGICTKEPQCKFLHELDVESTKNI